MIGTSFFDLIVIRTAITLLRSITPLSIIYTVSLPFLPATWLTRTVKLLSIYPACESAFYLFVYLPRRRWLQGAAQHPPLPPVTERRALFERVLATIHDPEAYLTQWFLGAPVEEIKEENVREFVRWSFFNAAGRWSVEEEGDEVEAEVDEYIGMMERAMGRKFESGRGKAECFRLTVDAVRMKHRPLLWYLIIGTIDFITFIRLSLAGFSFRRRPAWASVFSTFPVRLETLLFASPSAVSPSARLAYWYRPHRDPTKRPILYIHGIGIGMHPYVGMLATLAAAAPDVGIIVLELDAVCSRICASMPPREETTAAIHAILAHHGYLSNNGSEDGPGFVLCANSYGTILATHLLRAPAVAPHIASAILIDPVSLLLHLPAVAYNFLRRVPRRANEHMLHYFASTDPSVAHTLSRRFFWTENVLWQEDLPCNPVADGGPENNGNSSYSSGGSGGTGRTAVVYLGERDLIVDTWSVFRYLTAAPASAEDPAGPAAYTHSSSADEYTRTYPHGGTLKVVWCAGVDHAQVFDEKRWYSRIVADLVAASAGPQEY
ncbi:hypothetical protein DRE_04722 [Drechslerella stenobrocha 248]|uniref:AB hydrolase-1 domain-containing protein n=1 Tax=Drechslerella stenobrocha 248 TaxID=1043628 RepID=W7HRW4_9PEZI|nr:hypothetical protein DRE_04722 [Drechslerella stenobrocha 248]